MTTVIPAGLQYGTVRWVVVGVAPDASDIGITPDSEQVQGTVVFTPQLDAGQGIRYDPAGSGNGVTILSKPQTYSIVNGRLVDSTGNPDVLLLANNSADTSPQNWQYRVDFQLTDGYTFGTFYFSLSSGQTVDLTEAFPQSIPSSPVLYIKGDKGDPGVGAGGVGLPTGGTTGQALLKSSSVDYAVSWGTVTGGGGGGGIPAFADPAADRLVGWDDSANAWVPITVGSGLAWSAANVITAAIAAASETVQGVVELASSTEALAGTDATRAVHPLGLKAVADTKSGTAHTHAYATQADIDSASTADRARANHTGTQSVSTLSDLTENVQDIAAALIVAGANVTVSYDDVANTLTINAAAGGGGTTDPEIVRDTIGTALVAGAGITITVNDAGDTLTITSTAVLPTRSIATTAPLTGGGDLSANRTFAVSTGTSGAVGVLQLATSTEATTGTDTAKAVTPAGVAAAISATAGSSPSSKRIPRRFVGADLTLVAADEGTAIESTLATEVLLTIPTLAAGGPPVGSWVDIGAAGIGDVTVVPDVGVTLRAKYNVYKLTFQHTRARLHHVATDIWVMSGDNIEYATIARTGDWDDILNKPTTVQPIVWDGTGAVPTRPITTDQVTWYVPFANQPATTGTYTTGTYASAHKDVVWTHGA